MVAWQTLNDVAGVSDRTQKLNRFTSNKRLQDVTLDELQRFASSLESAGLKTASIRRTLAAIKSLFTFGQKLGALPFDTGRPLRLPKLADGLSDRILGEVDIQRMLAVTSNPRNHLLLLLLYASGCRVSEISRLKWKSVCARRHGGQITVVGKGTRSRSILLPPRVFDQLNGMRADASDVDPVFRSRKGGHLVASQILRIVRKAAKAAGLNQTVVVHSFRHCHASHALARNAPLSTVMATLGHRSIQSTNRYVHANPTDSSSNYLPL